MPGDRIKTQALPAGRFSAWLARTRCTLAGDTGMKVPCGSCRACCTSAYFIHIAPGEARTLAHIPRKMLAAAPGWPPGHRVLGYLENGHCPLFIGNRCSIYAHRPQTCRHYDCRIFAATGTRPGGRDKVAIARRARQWKFACPTRRDREQVAAVRAAAGFLEEVAQRLPAGAVPGNPSQLAVLAIKLCGVFLAEGAGSGHKMGKGIK